MALNIPMPGVPGSSFGRGIDAGSAMFSRIMQPIIERQRMAQMENHFQKEMALRQAAAARAGQNSDLQRAMMQEQLTGLHQKNEEFNALKNWMQNKRGNTGGQDDFAMRALAKKHYGMDPFAPIPQTPEEKQAMALNLFKQKEALKLQNKSGDMPTNPVLTQNQQALQGIDTVVPMIDEFINHPSKIYGRFDFDPSKKAAYNAKTSSMIDTLIAAQSLPKVQASIDLVEQQIKRAAGEGDSAYIERLKDLKKDLLARRERSQSVVKTRRVNTADLVPQQKTLHGKKYQKIDGEWHEV